jgi:methylmalonyl-CoA mutase C-terminal domain/subunit
VFTESIATLGVSDMSTQAASLKIRVLIAKPGLDGHDRGAKVIARALRDAGFEVIYTGLHQTPEMIVNAAIEEDVHVVGLSVLSGAHNALVPDVIEGVHKGGLTDVLVLVGGIIPEEDIPTLKQQGVHMVFTPGAGLQEVVDYIRANAPSRT